MIGDVCHYCADCYTTKIIRHGNNKFNEEYLCDEHLTPKQKMADFTDLRRFLYSPVKGYEGMSLWGQMCLRFIERWGGPALVATINKIEQEKIELQSQKYRGHFTQH